MTMQPARSDLVRGMSIPRIAFASQEDLATHLDGQTRPFIATGCIGSWLATQEWTPDYFVKRYGDFPVTASVDLPTQGVPYALSPAEHLLRTSMAEFVRRMDDAPRPSYLHQLSVKQFPGLQSATAFDTLFPLPPATSVSIFGSVQGAPARAFTLIALTTSTPRYLDARAFFCCRPNRVGQSIPLVTTSKKARSIQINQIWIDFHGFLVSGP